MVFTIIVLVLTTMLFVGAVIPVMRWFDQPHPTTAGRALTARGLGLASWLRGHESFTELPPAAVAVWDRYLSYGAALGVTPVVSRAADLAVGTREVLWSDYTGTWRQIRVRYVRRGRSSGYPPMTVIVNGLLVVGLLAVTAAFARDWVRQQPPVVLYLAIGLGALLAGRSLYRIVRAAWDRVVPVDVTGVVLTKSSLPYLTGLDEMRREVRKDGLLAKGLHPAGQPYFVVVDDGRADVTKVWTVYPAYRGGGQCEQGDTVRLRGYRWCRYARKVVVQDAARQAQAAAT